MSDRFYIPPTDWDTSALSLADDEAKHCTQVMRHREGDEIIVFNGIGDVARARIASIKKNVVTLECIRVEHIEQPTVRITLAPALIKADRWEWLLEKATELWVTEIQPLVTERCVVKLSAEDAARKHEKWQRLIIEACKQSRRAWVPVLHPVRRLRDWCDMSAKTNLSLVASLGDHAMPIKAAIKQSSKPTTARLIIGPEGDFSPEELQHILAEGFTPITLGSLTLRAETASIAALAILNDLLSD